jgi:hypothetical protein
MSRIYPFPGLKRLEIPSFTLVDKKKREASHRLSAVISARWFELDGHETATRKGKLRYGFSTPPSLNDDRPDIKGALFELGTQFRFWRHYPFPFNSRFASL